MYSDNELNDALWEALIKAAVIENSLNEIKEYPSEKELIDNVILPVTYNYKMKKLIKRFTFRKQHSMALNFAKKAIAGILVIFGISFALLLQVKEVRAACQSVIIHIYEKYIQFEYHPDQNNEEVSINIQYLPDDFYLIRKKSNEHQQYWEYQNNNGDVVKISWFVQNRTIYVDNEHYISSDIKINENDATYFESTNSNFSNYITWHTEKGFFRISSSLSQDIIVEIAKNIK